ncbi:MAG: holo-ACP synthase [Planctomycetota bacterium]|jgi:holo-[acyl-carrier protein] synthase
MNIVGHGIDLVECQRIAGVLERHETRFLERVLTAGERARASEFANPIPFVAGRWAAKEAILKMIGTGWRGQIAWSDMEILPDPLGAPRVTLSGETARKAEALGVKRILISITHTEHYAAASAIGVSD